ncbi:MAG TPA: SprT-like domain-containing protein [Gemmatimonadales bacterium]|nr:SprT-like domain-containing protein [Gemmatimonadales bacterium]
MTTHLDHALRTRFASLGLKGIREVRLHRNRVVMLSVRAGVLRLHAGYAHAPDPVLVAIVRYLTPYTRRAVRAAAQREFLAFPVDRFIPSRPRRPRTRRVAPGDAPLLARLGEAHARLNQAHFEGKLSAVPIRISGRMRRRLGEVSLHRETGAIEEMAFNRQHLRHDRWSEVEQTLLHEMVHQWQAENGLPVDHGAGFRRKAREVGIVPRARKPHPATVAAAGALDRLQPTNP